MRKINQDGTLGEYENIKKIFKLGNRGRNNFILRDFKKLHVYLLINGENNFYQNIPSLSQLNIQVPYCIEISRNIVNGFISNNIMRNTFEVGNITVGKNSFYINEAHEIEKIEIEISCNYLREILGADCFYENLDKQGSGIYLEEKLTGRIKKAYFRIIVTSESKDSTISNFYRFSLDHLRYMISL